ncbi:hypothetical protein [Allokutzneria oryzae]|uniref:PH domain-containing protein n=1 Tax=Allokutzneria oryzae TaxID=1378989 RepID=A0ABV6A346_9PSEU
MDGWELHTPDPEWRLGEVLLALVGAVLVIAAGTALAVLAAGAAHGTQPSFSGGPVVVLTPLVLLAVIGTGAALVQWRNGSLVRTLRITRHCVELTTKTGKHIAELERLREVTVTHIAVDQRQTCTRLHLRFDTAPHFTTRRFPYRRGFTSDLVRTLSGHNAVVSEEPRHTTEYSNG